MVSATVPVVVARSRRHHRWVLPVVSVVVALVLWEVFSRTGVLPPELPGPSVIGPWLWGQFQSPVFWGLLGTTLFQWLAGLLIASAAGVVVGLVIASSPVVNKLLLVPIEFLRPIPAVLYLPLLLLLFGARDGVGFGLAAVGAFWPVLFQTVYGVASLHPLALDTARMFGFTRGQRALWVLVPGVAPQVATGIRIAASVSLVIVVTIELLGGAPGLGAELRGAQLNAIYPAIYGLTFVFGVIGVLLNFGLERVERKVLEWHEPYRPKS